MSIDRRSAWAKILAFSCFFIFLAEGFSQPFTFERVPNELGLSQNYISAICQDQQHFIWVGTRNGLNRFNGYRFRTFTNIPGDAQSIPHNDIKALFVDSRGTLWIGTVDGLCYFDPLLERFHKVLLRSIENSDESETQIDVVCIAEDSTGHIWAGTNNGILYRIAADLKTVNNFDLRRQWKGKLPTDLNLLSNVIISMVVDENDNIWVSQIDRIIHLHIEGANQKYAMEIMDWEKILPPGYKPKSREEYLGKQAIEKVLDNHTFSIGKSQSGRLLIRTLHGVGQWNEQLQQFDFSPVIGPEDDVISSPFAGTGKLLAEDKEGRLWMGGVHALVIYDPINQRVIFRDEVNDVYGTDSYYLNMKSWFQDDSGNFWIGSRGNGLFMYAPYKERFKPDPAAHILEEQSIRSIYQTRDSILWFGDTGLRLYAWDRSKEKEAVLIENNFDWHTSSKSTFGYVFSMHEDQEGNLWAGCQFHLYRIKRDRKKILHIDVFFNAVLNGNIFDIHEDEQGQIWLISNGGLGRFNQKTGKLERISFFNGKGYSINSSGTPVIHEAKDGMFWLGMADGLLCFNPKNEQVESFRYQEGDSKSLSNNNVKFICPDPQEPDEYLWLGTGGGGLNKFSISSGEFEHYGIEEGLPDEVVYAILPDEFGNLWLSTNQGLCKFNPEDSSVENFTASDGLQNNEFNSCASHKALSGELFFGGIEGINHFYPSKILINPYKPNVVITDLRLANEFVRIGDENGLLKGAISELEEIELSYKEKVFSFSFTSLDFTDPKRNQFAYMLEPFQEEWQYIGNRNEVTFTNIDPGNYTFRVKASNANNTWNEEGTSLEIYIAPPWWQRWWAYVVYGLVIGGIIYFVYKLQLNRQLDRAEKERLAEMDELKTRLFTNITHEFRTPLTVMLGMTEQIKGQEQSKNLIKRNGEKLLRLVNQLLDLSKLENNQLKLNLQQSDIIFYLNYLTESFYSLAQQREIRIVFYSEESELLMDFDEAKMQHIVYNLISNALKFTSAGGKVILHAELIDEKGKRKLQLKFKDDGIGMEEGDLVHIFDRFHQLDNSFSKKGEGTGIGLSLTKELVELKGGEIQVESKIDKGTTFTVTLPISNKAALSQNTPIATLSSSEATSVLIEDEEVIRNHLPLVLVVEDNQDIRLYMHKVLDKHYQMIEAENGELGLSIAQNEIPDLIISDVMMPKMNGYELCTALKNHHKTNHIPVVMLTAKAMDEDKLKGLKTGADAYLMKPFSEEELLIRLEQLLQLRRTLQDRYQNFEQYLTYQKAPLTPEDLFIQKLQQLVIERIDDSSLKVEDLAKVVQLSTSQLYRKLKAITNQTPNLFIRKIRLQRAKKLLNDPQLNISEVAYAVGFEDPGYFSRVFHQEFGLSPLSFRK